MVTHLIDHWHKRMVNSVEPLGLESGTRLVTGCPLWGDEYITQFLQYGLPSILAPRNRAALEAAGWELVMFVDQEADDRLRETGIPMRLVRLPEDIMAGVRANPAYRYPLLAAAHNLLIHKARDCGGGFHMMVGDTIYSSRYFERLLDLGSHIDAIAHTGLVAEGAKALPALDDFRRSDGSLTASALVLGAIGLEFMAPEWRSWNMDGITDFEEMPNSQDYIHVRGQETVRIHATHMNAAWIGNDRCLKVDTALGGTIDSELPRYMAGGFYVPTLEDDMAILATAGAKQPVLRWPWEDYKREFWASIGGKPGQGSHNLFVPYFMNAVKVPVPHDPEAPDDAELDVRFGRLMEKLNA